MATENVSSEDVVSSQAVENSGSEDLGSPATLQEPKPSYVKLAMRNMVRKRGKSLQHFFLTTIALLGLFIGLAYLTR